MIIPNIWKNKKCSKPPTRYWWRLVWSWCLISIDLWPWSKIKLGGILFSDEPMRHCCGQNVRITGVVPLPLHPDAVNGSSNPQARSPSQKYSLRSCSAMSSPSLANDSSSKTLNRNHKFPSVKPISWDVHPLSSTHASCFFEFSVMTGALGFWYKHGQNIVHSRNSDVGHSKFHPENWLPSPSQNSQCVWLGMTDCLRYGKSPFSRTVQ